jgi:hypothetical protein
MQSTSMHRVKELAAGVLDGTTRFAEDDEELTYE